MTAPTRLRLTIEQADDRLWTWGVTVMHDTADNWHCTYELSGGVEATLDHAIYQAQRAAAKAPTFAP